MIQRFAQANRSVLNKQKKGKNMVHHCVKLIGSGNYHIYSRLVLGNFLLGDKKK